MATRSKRKKQKLDAKPLTDIIQDLKRIVRQLEHLSHSSVGPDDLLDSGNYSRPVPPRQASGHRLE
jgi:hypothetical protein